MWESMWSFWELADVIQINVLIYIKRTDREVYFIVNKVVFCLFVLICGVPCVYFLSNKYNLFIIFIQRLNMYAQI